MKKRRVLIAVVAVLLGIQAGCSVFSRASSAGATMSADQVKEAMLNHLIEKYGEEFFVNGVSESPAHSALEAPNVWTMGAWPTWGTREKDIFQAVWRSPQSGSEDEITDNYLLIKMRSLFHDSIDEGLASVLDEFMAEYTISAWDLDVSALSGTISDEEFLQWAAQNVSIGVNAAIPADEGFSKEDLARQLAPLSSSGNAFGAKTVGIDFTVYHQDGYRQLADRYQKEGMSNRTVQGMWYDFANSYHPDPDRIWFWQKISWNGS